MSKKAQTAQLNNWKQALIEQRVVRWSFQGKVFRLTSYPTVADRDANIAARPASYDYEIITGWASLITD